MAALRANRLAALGLVTALQTAWGQSGPATSVEASISGSVNHVETRRSSGADTRDLVLQLRPGLVVTSRSGRVRGTLAYSADLQQHSASARDFDIAHSLNAAFTAEAVDNWAFIDATASLARRAVSAYGVQVAPSSALGNNNNQDDVANATLRPYVRGVLGGSVSYNAALFASASRTRNSALGDVNERGGNLALGSLSGGLFGWGLDASHRRTDYLAGRATIDERVVASLNFRPDVDWAFSLRGGQESTDVGSLDKRRYDNWGAGLRWTPSPRTVFSADLDQRYFGRSWALVLEHRFAQSALRLTSSRGASSSNNSGADGNGITVYQLLFAQLASQLPDPVARDALVRQMLLQGQIDPSMRVPGGSLGNAVSLQRRTDLGWTYAGGRLTLALQASSSYTNTLDTLAPRLGDGPVSQRGLIASVAWRLTPTASSNLSLSQLKTANEGTRAGNDLNSIAIGVGDQIGLRTTASLSARHSRQSGGPDPYRETALGAALSHRF